MNVLVIASYDSFLKAGYSVASSINNANIDVFIHKIKKNQISEAQLKASKVLDGAVKFGSVDSFIDEEIMKYDVIILSVGNSLFEKIILKLKKLSEKEKKRGIIVGVFPGVIFGDTDSITSRINSDILLCNSQLDYLEAKKIARFSNSNVILINYGLINLDLDFKKIECREKKNIYFIDQVKIPDTVNDRKYILEKLIALAKKYSHYNFIVKSRLKSLSDRTVHPNKMDYRSLLETYRNIPENIKVIYEDISESYTKMDMCLSISSTVIYESIFYGIPRYAISDLGISNKLANKGYLDSNIFVSFDSLIENLEFYFTERYVKKWADENIFSFDKNRSISLNYMLQKKIKNDVGFLFSRRAPAYTPELNFFERFKRKSIKLIRTPKQFFVDSFIFNVLKDK